MTLEQIAYIAQIAGVLVVAATLIFLALQVRQGTDLLRSDARQTQLTNDQTGVTRQMPTLYAESWPDMPMSATPSQRRFSKK